MAALAATSAPGIADHGRSAPPRGEAKAPPLPKQAAATRQIVSAERDAQPLEPNRQRDKQLANVALQTKNQPEPLISRAVPSPQNAKADRNATEQSVSPPKSSLSVNAAATRRNAQRARRGTIIGVAEPANAPVTKSLPPLGVKAFASASPGASRVPAAVTSASTVARSSARAQPGTSVASTRESATIAATASSTAASVGTTATAQTGRRPARALHKTIIGVAAPANAPDLEPASSDRGSVRVPSLRVVPQRDGTVDPPQPLTTRAAPAEIKRTIIGGLQAPSNPATSRRAVGLGIPTEAKWNVLIPKQGPTEMTAPDIIREFALGNLTRDVNVWREGMHGWQPLSEVASLRPLFQRANLSLDPPPPPPEIDQAPQPVSSSKRERSTRSSFDEELPTVPHSPTLRPSHASRSASPIPAGPHTAQKTSTCPASTSRSPPLTDGSREPFDPKNSGEATRIAPSPWQVPDVGAKAAAQLASNAGLPPRQNSIPPSRRNHFEHSPLDRPSRRPDIGPRATVRGQLAALTSRPAPPPQSAPPSAREPLPPARSSANTSDAPQQLVLSSTPPLPPPIAISTVPPSGPHTEPRSVPKLPHTLDLPQVLVPSTRALSAKPQLRRRWWFWTLLVLVIASALALSYRTKQPRIAYAYMHRRGWDVPIDRAVNRVAPKIGYATENYVKKPYRAAAQKLKSKLKR